VLPGGYVVVGSLPTTNGKSATAKYGCLIVLDSNGKPVSTISGPNHPGTVGHDLDHPGQTSRPVRQQRPERRRRKGVHTIDNSTVLRIRISPVPARRRRFSARR
jgi:hypothetical protein